MTEFGTIVKIGGEVVERERLLHIVGDLRDGLAELRPVGQLERGDRTAGVVAVLGVQISAKARLAPGCADFGNADSTLAILWNQHLRSRGLGEHLPRRTPEP